MQKLVDADDTTDFVRIAVSGNNQTVVYDLHEGESALVGQAAGCQLRLFDDSLAPHQCLMELQNGALLLHNWSALDSTTINGNSVDEEVTLEQGDVVAFSHYQVQVQWGASPAISMEPTPVDIESISPMNQLVHEPLTDSDVSVSRRTDETEIESVEDSTIALLHTEIAFLQKELEQRDSTIARREHVAESQPPPGSISTERLEGLLVDLRMADDRVMSLTDELKLLEELRVAETEEREQVTNWVGEIEKRLSRREQEQLAEIAVLKNRLDREKNDRLTQQKRADESIQGGDNGTEQLQSSLEVLRHDHELLRDEYDEAISKVGELEKETQRLREESTEAAIEQRITEAVRLEQLAIAQERASISRREHDLANRLREIENQLENKERVHEADARFQVFRERLKELHQQEVVPTAPSVGQRLLKMWRSLDGPTDTD